MGEDSIDEVAVRGLSALIIGALGFVMGLLAFGVISAAYLGGALLIGWGFSQLIPSLNGLPVLPATLVLTGTALLLMDVVYTVFRPDKLRKGVLSLYESAPADWNRKQVRERLTPRQAEAMMIASVRGMILAILAVTLVFESLYAASVSWGLQQMYPNSEFFGGESSPGPWSHFLFWLGVPFDLFLLDAPSLFGFALSDLEPNNANTALLVGIFLFKTVLVANVIRLVFELVTFKPPTTIDD